MQKTDNDAVKPKAAIILDMNPEDETISVSGGVGQIDVQASITIKDKRVWAIIGLIVIIVAGAKAAGLW